MQSLLDCLIFITIHMEIMSYLVSRKFEWYKRLVISKLIRFETYRPYAVVTANTLCPWDPLLAQFGR